MSELVRLYVVLPAYNEAENIPTLLDSLAVVASGIRALGYSTHYIVVDDGSDDETPAILTEYKAKLPIEVIRHEPNQGLGPTLRDGFKRASDLAKGADIVVAMDADNTHPVGLIPTMLQKVKEGNDVVIASRYRPGSRVVGLSLFRHVMAYGARSLFTLIFPISGVRDYTCGFRAYRASVLQNAFRQYGAAFIEHEGFQCSADILLRLSRLGAIMNEVPMILRYDLKEGASKMRVGKTVHQTILLLIQRRFETFFRSKRTSSSR